MGIISNRGWLVLSLLVLALAVGCGWWFFEDELSTEKPHPLSLKLNHAELTNSYFSEDPVFADLPPKLRSIPLPDFPGAFAIWGATGRDRNGHIFFGISPYAVPDASARLYEYDPDQDRVEVLGNVLSQLKMAGLERPGNQQAKIHSKIIQMGDGHLYFTSMDEPEPGFVGEKRPIWGSHLWRLRMPERTWEHLLQAEEGLIALNGTGGLLYSLGFPDHTLYQFDCATNAVKKIAVGSIEGHISRNLLTDARGHVYVPRLRMVQSNHAEHTLVEFDSKLHEVGENPLPFYQWGSAEQCHGIIAYQHLPDQSIAFTTHTGRLFILHPHESSPATLIDMGWFHREGKAYVPSLFTCSGTQQLYGVAQRQFDGRTDYEWIRFDMKTCNSEVIPVTWPTIQGAPLGDALLYGCQTRDSKGRFYIVGACRAPSGGRKPVLIQAMLGD